MAVCKASHTTLYKNAMKNKTGRKIQKRWNDALDNGCITATNEIVDFAFSSQGQDYYDAAISLKANGVNGSPYYVLLSLSIECYLKSIRTKIYWSGSIGVGVMHEKGHDLLKLFSNLNSKYPKDALYLSNEYQNRYKRDLSSDLARNANVFTNQRYPYKADHSIPQPDRGFWHPECTEETELDNYTYIDITALETVAVFLHEELTFTTNY
ncbi:hypothetical protein AB4251_14470 [Vibrio lentus]|uniref:HEPN domain-containing protein n=1 Tax=Vibrio lentus TaxID=136468 RepID=A0AB36XPK4_9VIBR|nr:hypothetical protein [Vibrio lentus]MCC4835006.1 hypothetical protein [Vibrio lentus]PMI17422.1 hypothetical protein BCU51_01460 [Vibrio lentus]PMK48117.1 hypothetical protein BCT99_14705 [Vibrio lentus]PML30951.1 hypothetical protein BCT79_20080 [Vibrio lentus]PMM34050.1 hypothetical protein BCT56_10745 [Vibrio lentus]